MPDEKKRTFDDDDLFERKPYAAFLKNLILNCNNYHRDDDIKAYTIALDSPWGTGKSVFLEKFEAMLEQDCQDNLRVVHYNAWENDFWDNAFEPFADAVFSHPLFASPLADQTEGSAGKKFGDALKHLALAFAKKRLDDYFDSPEMVKALEAAMSAAGAAASQKPTIISPKYSNYKISLQTIQEAMEKVLEENDPGDPSKTVKLVIIIDELDRCRPTFAIETLEIVKHVMDVPNVVYLFALDVQQLGAAIKKVYGSETDATGYLMRFFSYYSRLPEADLRTLISSELKDYYPLKDPQKLFYHFSNISKEMNLSPRDIETVVKVYKIMLSTFLNQYLNINAHILYWCLLCQKYKSPLLFDKQMKATLSDEEIDAFLNSCHATQSTLGSIFKIISENEPIKNISLNKILDEKSNNYTKVYLKNVLFDDPSLVNEPDGIILQVSFAPTDVHSLNVFMSKSDSLADFLFYPDLLHWKEIRRLTPGQFLLKQLEMFNFMHKSSE